MEKIVIFDTGMPEAVQNNIFDRQFACSISHTLLPLCHLYEEAQKVGIRFITPDVFIEHREQFNGKEVLLISHLVHPHTKQLIALGARPFLLMCQESPFIATRFYINLKDYSDMFTHSMLFPGMKKRVSKNTHFIPMFFPQIFTNQAFQALPFEDRRFAAYIASNKEMTSLMKRLALKLLYGSSVELVYSFRRKIIRFLSRRNDFDLYGRGWGADKADYIQKIYKGTVDDKEKKLREYKFILCLENAVFPGYITEKIFDSFFAGTVPVYIGAPDIATYIPKDTFIHVTDYKNLEELEQYMDSISETAYNMYLKNIHAFLRSPACDRFSHQRFSETIINLIESA